MRWLVRFLVVTTAFSAIAADFGKEIDLKNNPATGKLSLGITFTLGASDPDGDNWMLTFTKKGALPDGTTWNIYRKDASAYVFLSWKPAFAGEVFQAKLSDTEAASVLPHQADLILVLKLPSGELAHLSIGDFCKNQNYQGYFKNLTDNKRCSEVTATDVKHDELTPHRSSSGRSTH